MLDPRTGVYADDLSKMIRMETVSTENQTDKTKFYAFQDLLKELFPELFSACEMEDFNGSFVLRLKGNTDEEPILLMNHQDVVEAPGEWKYPPFAGTIAGDKLWGRGTLDTKGGLWAMLQAGNELVKSGFTPKRDVYFVSTCTEETDGSGAEAVSHALFKRGLRFHMVLDEGGMIVTEPIAGAKGAFAVVGVGEKGCVDLKFVARSEGGHASTPARNSPLVRLGKFMSAVERKKVFQTELSPTVCAMFKKVSTSMRGGLKFVLGHPKLFKPILKAVMPKVSNTANAMLKTTVAFTMAKGSNATNVMPQTAWVIGDMRYSHHQGREKSIEAITKLAKKYDVETVVLSKGVDSPLSDYRSDAFALVERAVSTVFPEVKTTPYVMTGASDCRYMSLISENCLRFTPFVIDDEQLDNIHGVDENVDLSALAPAVDFYRYIITEA